MQASLLFPGSFSTEAVKALKCTELPPPPLISKGTFLANPERLPPGKRARYLRKLNVAEINFIVLTPFQECCMGAQRSEYCTQHLQDCVYGYMYPMQIPRNSQSS